MKVLQVCSYYSSALYRLLFDSLRNRGIEQDVYYFAVNGTEFSHNEKNVYFSRCYSQLDRFFFAHKERKVLDSLYGLLDVKKYDITHAHSLFSNGYVSMAIKRKFGIPYIVAVRNSDVNEFFKLRPWLRRIGLEIMREADQVIFISPSYKSTVLQEFVPSDERVLIEGKSKVIPNGINELFLSSKPESARKNDGVIRIVQAGDINKNKNQTAVVSACKRLINDGLEVEYLVVGRDKDRRISRRLCENDFTVVEGPKSQEELVAVYRNSDVFVMPSVHETFGLVYVEAMSQGLPVVYSRNQGFDGYFDAGYVGYPVDSSSSDEIAAAIVDCYKRKQDLFVRCLQEADKFSWNRLSHQYCEIYKAAVGES